MPEFSTRIRALAIAGIVACAVCAGATMAEARTVAGKTPTHLKAKTRNTDASTGSSNFINIPEAELDIKAKKGPIIITFSAVCSTLSRVVIVRAKVGDVTVRPISETRGVAFCGTRDNRDNANAQTHSYTWVYDNPSPGRTVVKIQFRSLTTGEVSRLDEYTTLVQYRRK